MHISFYLPFPHNPHVTPSFTDVPPLSGSPSHCTFRFHARKRVTSSFYLNITDAFPYKVKKVEIVLTPSQDQGVASAPYTLNPTTGLSPKVQTYKAEINRSEDGKFSFPIRFNFLLTSAEQTMDVVINMKDEKGEVLYTRTLQNVSFKQHRVTEAKGTFFSSDVTGSFDFDIQDDDQVTVPLYPKN